MAKLLEVQIGKDNPILRAKSIPVKNFDNAFKKFVKDMRLTMIKKDGLGLAAPQVGRNIRIIMVTLNSRTSHKAVTAMINPEILSFGEEVETAEEGCLSLPGIWDKVERSKNITVSFIDFDGEKQILKLEGLNARVVQHEVDHLDGILFIDRVKTHNKRKKNAIIM